MTSTMLLSKSAAAAAASTCVRLQQPRIPSSFASPSLHSLTSRFSLLSFRSPCSSSSSSSSSLPSRSFTSSLPLCNYPFPEKSHPVTPPKPAPNSTTPVSRSRLASHSASTIQLLEEEFGDDFDYSDASSQPLLESAKATYLKQQAARIKQQEDFEKYREYEPTPVVLKKGVPNATAKGARKTSKATVTVKKGTGQFTVNGVRYVEYFHRYSHSIDMVYPLLVCNRLGDIDMECTTHGGGKSGQAGAIRLAVARCLAKIDPENNKALLQSHSLLRRDNRMVERKKAGRYKARKAHPFVQR